MNIFVLDLDFNKCAQYHADRHCVKMILEGAQLLNNAIQQHNPDFSKIYKVTHKNHPASKWASTNRANFNWLNNLVLALCKEYTYRYGRIHKCQSILEYFATSEFNIPIGELTPFAQCMPEIYRQTNAVEAYREYYRKEKQHIAQWKNRPIPYWWNK
jgi:hypothetical protein